MDERVHTIIAGEEWWRSQSSYTTVDELIEGRCRDGPSSQEKESHAHAGHTYTHGRREVQGKNLKQGDTEKTLGAVKHLPDHNTILFIFTCMIISLSLSLPL